MVGCTKKKKQFIVYLFPHLSTDITMSSTVQKAKATEVIFRLKLFSKSNVFHVSNVAIFL